MIATDIYSLKATRPAKEDESNCIISCTRCGPICQKPVSALILSDRFVQYYRKDAKGAN